VKKNVASKVKVPTVRHSKVRPLTKEQVDRLAESIRDTWIEPIVHIGVRLGLRNGEIRALLWADVDFKKGRLRVSGSMQPRKQADGKRKPTRVTTKTDGSDRTIPLPSGLAEILRHHREQQRKTFGATWIGRGLVFTNGDGEPLNGDTLLHHFKKFAVAAGLPRSTRLHDLRHTCASLLIAEGAHPRQIMELLGHKSIKTTMDTYGHLYEDVSRETVEKLDRLFAGGAR
jgi:integrase